MDEKAALQHCAALCSQREMCLRDIDDKLARYELEADACERIKQQLVRERYVDEERYATYFARDKARFNGWGPQKIRFELRQKGIPSATVDEAIESVGNDLFAEQLLRAIEAKVRTKSNADQRKLWASLMRFGVSRGFDYAAVKKAIGIALDSDNADDDEVCDTDNYIE